jgi:hypothetical protein
MPDIDLGRGRRHGQQILNASDRPASVASPCPEGVYDQFVTKFAGREGQLLKVGF